tara:strand:+ start:633 stop:887 length:255 start_codon:yes stop_codon:yes gene_type:complete
MKIGDLVEIGWNGKDKRPLIGVIVEMYPKSGQKTGYVMVNGKTQYVDLEKLRLVNDDCWINNQKQEYRINRDNCGKKQSKEKLA